jgi:hypothetical protein
MPVNKEQTIGIKSFIRGIDQSQDKQLIGLSAGMRVDNCDVSDGILKRSKGYTKYSPAQLAYAPKTIMAYYNGGVGKLIVAANKALYELSNDTFSVITGTENYFSEMKMDYINYQSKEIELLILTNGQENVKVYDGSSVRNLKHDGASSTAGTSNIAPKGKYIELYKERVFMAGEHNSPNSVFFSKDFDPDDWTAPTTPDTEVNMHGGEIQIPTWDGGSIIGMKALRDMLLVFKNRVIFALTGSYPGEFASSVIFSSVNGDIIDKTISVVDNMAMWATTEGIFLFDGNGTKEYTPRIKNYWDAVDKEGVKNACGIIYKNKYYLAVPSYGGDINDAVIEIDLTTDSVAIHTWVYPNQFINYEGQCLFIDDDGYIYIYGEGDKNSTTMISSVYDTGDIYMDAMITLDKVRFVGYGDGVITIYALSGDKVISKDVTLTLEDKLYEVEMYLEGPIMSFEFINSGGCYFEIKEPVFVIELDEF